MIFQNLIKKKIVLIKMDQNTYDIMYIEGYLIKLIKILLSFLYSLRNMENKLKLKKILKNKKKKLFSNIKFENLKKIPPPLYS